MTDSASPASEASPGPNGPAPSITLDDVLAVYESMGVLPVPEIGKILDRWWSKVVLPSTDPDGCWLWVGGLDKTNTYGVFWDGEKMVPAHHWGYRHGGGILTATKPTLDHNCRTTLCVNPNHLTPVSRTVNSRRRSRQGKRRTR